MAHLALDPTLLETLRTLQDHGVECIVVGDLARAIHDDGGAVSGVAIVPASYGRNAARLAAALHALGADRVGAPAAAPLDPRDDLRDLAPCSFRARHVTLDIDFEPAGTRGYRDLFDEAMHVDLGPGARPLVAAAQDLDRVARAGGAPIAPATPPTFLPSAPAGFWPAGEVSASRPVVPATRT